MTLRVHISDVYSNQIKVNLNIMDGCSNVTRSRHNLRGFMDGAGCEFVLDDIVMSALRLCRGLAWGPVVHIPRSNLALTDWPVHWSFMKWNKRPMWTVDPSSKPCHCFIQIYHKLILVYFAFNFFIHTQYKKWHPCHTKIPQWILKSLNKGKEQVADYQLSVVLHVRTCMHWNFEFLYLHVLWVLCKYVCTYFVRPYFCTHYSAPVCCVESRVRGQTESET